MFLIKNKIIICILIILLLCSVSYGIDTSYVYDESDEVLASIDNLNIIGISYDKNGNIVKFVGNSNIEIDLYIHHLEDNLFTQSSIEVIMTTVGEEYGNITYEFAIGTSIGGTDVLSWTPFEVALDGSVTLTGLTLIHGQTYYISGRVENFTNTIVSNVANSNAITVYYPNSDEDGDTFDNQSELVAESDPFNINSFPGLTQINLVPGFNLISIPADISKKPDLLDWLPVVGTITEVSKVMVKGEGETVYSSFIPENISNPSYSLYGDEGLLVYANEQKVVTFNSVLCLPHDLRAGFNFIGFSCAPEGYSAYQLIEDLGFDYVSSVQRFSVERGSFETAGFRDILDPTGVDFPIERGVGYFIYMKNDLLGFSP